MAHSPASQNPVHVQLWLETPDGSDGHTGHSHGPEGSHRSGETSGGLRRVLRRQLRPLRGSHRRLLDAEKIMFFTDEEGRMWQGDTMVRGGRVLAAMPAAMALPGPALRPPCLLLARPPAPAHLCCLAVRRGRCDVQGGELGMVGASRGRTQIPGL